MKDDIQFSFAVFQLMMAVVLTASLVCGGLWFAFEAADNLPIRPMSMFWNDLFTGLMLIALGWLSRYGVYWAMDQVRATLYVQPEEPELGAEGIVRYHKIDDEA